MIIIVTPTVARIGVWLEASDVASAGMAVVPVAPKINAMPYRKNAVANEPRRKYLIAASGPLALFRRKPAMMYVEIEEISSATKTTSSSAALVISIMPTAP